MQNQRQVAFRDHVWQTDLPEDSFVVKIARLLHNTPAKSPTKTRNFRKRRTSPSETCLLVKQNLRARWRNCEAHYAAIKCLLQQPLNDVLFFWLSSWHERYRETENPLCRTIACFETGYTQCQGSVEIEILFNLNDLFVTKGDDQERSDRYWEILKLFV